MMRGSSSGLQSVGDDADARSLLPQHASARLHVWVVIISSGASLMILRLSNGMVNLDRHMGVHS
jgi:hypothetical protein